MATSHAFSTAQLKCFHRCSETGDIAHYLTLKLLSNFSTARLCSRLTTQPRAQPPSARVLDRKSRPHSKIMPDDASSCVSLERVPNRLPRCCARICPHSSTRRASMVRMHSPACTQHDASATLGAKSRHQLPAPRLDHPAHVHIISRPRLALLRISTSNPTKAYWLAH